MVDEFKEKFKQLIIQDLTKAKLLVINEDFFSDENLEKLLLVYFCKWVVEISNYKIKENEKAESEEKNDKSGAIWTCGNESKSIF